MAAARTEESPSRKPQTKKKGTNERSIIYLNWYEVHLTAYLPLIVRQLKQNQRTTPRTGSTFSSPVPSLLDLVELPLELVEPPLELGPLPFDLVPLLFELAEPPFDLIPPLLDLVPLPLDLLPPTVPLKTGQGIWNFQIAIDFYSVLLYNQLVISNSIIAHI